MTTGVAVGCGWQAFVAYVNVGCYYIVGIPLGCLLGFYFDLGAAVTIIIPAGHCQFLITACIPNLCMMRASDGDGCSKQCRVFGAA